MYWRLASNSSRLLLWEHENKQLCVVSSHSRILNVVECVGLVVITKCDVCHLFVKAAEPLIVAPLSQQRRD